MRTDHKIGIAAVVLLGVVIVTWTALNSGPEADPGGDEQTVPPPEADRLADRRDPLDDGGFYARREDRVPESLSGGFIGTGGRSEDPPGDTTDTTTGTTTGDPGERRLGSTARDDLADARRAAELAMGNRTDDPPGREPEWWSSSGRTSGAGLPGDTGRTPETPARTTTYTVKESDEGFWSVAKNVYGDGKHWALIAQANPQADSDTLRAGQRLKIPPLPAPSDGTATGGAASRSERPGQLVTGADGKQYYVVQKGDAGFWAVSVRAYGSGKHWQLIARANPSVSSGSLKEGQKLLVPRRAAGAAATAATPTRTLKPGETWYTVVDGDAGFWDVAKKSYGAGKHWEVIARANPNVNSGRLRKGQKILVPPLPPSSARRRTPPAGSRVTRTDIPIFE